MKRIRPSTTVHQLQPPVRLKLTLAEQQTIARRRAVVDLPKHDRDFAEIWGSEKQPKRSKRA